MDVVGMRVETDQISWMTQDWERRESRTRIALDQSLELQSLANSILSATVDAISERKRKVHSTNQRIRNPTLTTTYTESFSCNPIQANNPENGEKMFHFFFLFFLFSSRRFYYFIERIKNKRRKRVETGSIKKWRIGWQLYHMWGASINNQGNAVCLRVLVSDADWLGLGNVTFSFFSVRSNVIKMGLHWTFQ